MENAVKCQLVIEKTIVDIESIKKEDRRVFLLCDTNCMDTKVNIEQPVWDKFLTICEVNLFKYQDLRRKIKEKL